MLDESKAITRNMRFSQVKELFEDDPRWQVSCSSSTAFFSVLRPIA